jgi:hypothetical protein
MARLGEGEGEDYLGGALGAADAEVPFGRLLQITDPVRIELALDPGPRRRGLLERPRVDDLVGVLPDGGVLADVRVRLLQARRVLPVAHRLVQAAAVEGGPD